MKTKLKIKIYILPIIAISILIALDQLTKFIITSSFDLYESKPVIKGVFSITYVQNKGIAWGMLEGKRILFLITTLITLVLLFALYINIARKNKFILMRIGLIVLIAGAIGNMIDRIKLGYVIDFFDFNLIDFPVFNLADIYVVISMIYIIILLFFKYSNEEFDEMFSRRDN